MRAVGPHSAANTMPFRRINTPGASAPANPAKIDAVIGFLVGVMMAFAVTRFAHDRTWRLALVFFGGFLVASLALVLFRGGLAQTSAVLRQTIMLTFVVASAAVFLPFPRPALVARPPAR